MIPLRLAAALGLCALLVPGCCTHRRGYGAPTAARLVATLQRPAVPVGSLRAKAKVDQWTKKGRIKVRVFILATAAGKLRFEAVSPFDTALVTLTADGQRFSSIDHKNHVFYSGPAKACNIARVFGLALAPAEVARALSGGVPVIAHRQAALRWDRCRGAEELTLSGEGGLTQRIWMRQRGGAWQVLRATVRDAKGKVVVALSFEHHRRHGARWAPDVIKLQQPARGSDVIIRYQKLELDVEIPDEAFRLAAPAGLPERVLDCETE
jgi:hypothetical protein